MQTHRERISCQKDTKERRILSRERRLRIQISCWYHPSLGSKITTDHLVAKGSNKGSKRCQIRIFHPTGTKVRDRLAGINKNNTYVNQMSNQTGVDPTLHTLHQTYEERKGRQDEADYPIARARRALPPRSIESTTICAANKIEVRECENETTKLITKEEESHVSELSR